MSKIVKLPVITRLDGRPSDALEHAIEKGLASVVIVGITEDGDEYFKSSVADGGTVIWMMERAKLKLLRIADGE
jgi:hypothetical protein